MKDLRIIPNKGLTHAGEFHADDVFSAALLKILNPDIVIERAFVVPKDYNGIVFDIGNGEFDHHQKDNEYRQNGIPYASLGKLWRTFGNRLVSEKAVKEIDEKLIQGLDDSDNNGIYNSLAIVISDLNPSWNDNTPSDEKFNLAVSMATEILKNTIQRAKDKELAKDIVDKAILNAKSKEIIILPQYCPAIDYLISTSAKFVIFPSNRGGYGIQVIPKEKGTQEAKIDFPLSWAGQRETLANNSKINGLTFCHNARFFCAADTLESAVKTAITALNNKQEYDKQYDQEVKNIISDIKKEQIR